MGKDCKERITFTFLKYIWNYPKYRKPFLLDRFKEVEKRKDIFVLNSIKVINNFKFKIRHTKKMN